MKYFFLLVLFAIQSCCITVYGNYKYSDIPEYLKKNANAIVRYDKAEFTINSKEKGQLYVKYAITILNKNADDQALLYVFYDKLIKVSKISACVYNSNGELITKIKDKDFYDRSINSTGTLYSDNRVKIYEVLQSNYPYTVEFEYTLDYNGLIHFPRWMPIDEYKTSIESSECIIKTNPEIKFRYKAVNYDNNPEESFKDNFKVYRWSAENLSAIEDEPYNPLFTEIVPIVYFAPNNFFYDGYYGNQETWEELGKWVNQLLIGRDQLTEKTKVEIANLISGISNKKEIAKILYEYMQSKTRYVSIQLGIGGFQPFSATEVDQTGYGDCKALSNYMVALLKEADIKSYYAIIEAGKKRKDLFTDFSSINQMNHVIVCVPFDADTIWLECTSQKEPFGYLGTFTDNRYALLIKPEGGSLARTKSYNQNDNVQCRKAKIKLYENGDLSSDINTLYRGQQYENVSDQLYLSKEEQKKELYNSLDIKNLEIQDFNYTFSKEIIPVASENISINVKNYGSMSGNRMFLPLNLFNIQSNIPKKVNERKTNVVLDNLFTDYDTLSYTIPENYSLEYLPESIEIKSKFGTYASRAITDGNRIIYIRINSRKKCKYAPDAYQELIDYFKEISKADKQKAVLIRKE